MNKVKLLCIVLTIVVVDIQRDLSEGQSSDKKMQIIIIWLCLYQKMEACGGKMLRRLPCLYL
jgi:hypothetical protein